MRQVRIVVPFAAGSVTDVMARVLAQKFGAEFGQPFTVDNRGGANGNLGGAQVAASPPDGSTILFSTTGPLSLNKLIYKNTPYDPVTDFIPIILFAEVPLMVSAHPSVPAKNIAELVANYLQHVQSGKVRAIGMLSPARSTALPDVPAVSETGIAVSAMGWFGMVGPAGLPAAIVQKLNAASNEYLASDEGKIRLRELNLKAIGGTPADYAKFVAAEMAKWKPVIEPIAASIQSQ